MKPHELLDSRIIIQPRLDDGEGVMAFPASCHGHSGAISPPTGDEGDAELRGYFGEDFGFDIVLTIGGDERRTFYRDSKKDLPRRDRTFYLSP